MMNIQSAEEYKTNVEKEEKERGFLESRSRGLREEGELEPGSREGVGAGGLNSVDGVGAGAREKRDAVRNMSMKRRRD